MGFVGDLSTVPVLRLSLVLALPDMTRKMHQLL
jgi:hypothetical protein